MTDTELRSTGAKKNGNNFYSLGYTFGLCLVQWNYNIRSDQVHLTTIYFGPAISTRLSASELPYSNWLICRVPGCYCANGSAAFWSNFSISGFHNFPFIFIQLRTYRPITLYLFHELTKFGFVYSAAFYSGIEKWVLLIASGEHKSSTTW